MEPDLSELSSRPIEPRFSNADCRPTTRQKGGVSRTITGRSVVNPRTIAAITVVKTRNDSGKYSVIDLVVWRTVIG
ncbi:hypothetical protein [Nocardia sp. CC201C]|uniref:hypothetical protein n=1 Tax=Nocardia sp. CC201C TaxID=3044575 RepID=UPI0024A895EF|nr:hypothetical protein [Nocardia sp. CC201C]